MNKVSDKSRPLIVDLDGTLIKSDILVETLLKYLKLNLFNIIRFIGFVIKGKRLCCLIR